MGEIKLLAGIFLAGVFTVFVFYAVRNAIDSRRQWKAFKKRQKELDERFVDELHEAMKPVLVKLIKEYLSEKD